jgi:ATP-dependent Clp protease, protease subunit
VVFMADAAGPPGAGGSSSWLQDALYERRIVSVSGRLDDQVAARAAATLMSLDATGDTPIEVHVDSPDGTLEAGFVLIDVLGMIRAPVRALCRGVVGTPAIGVVAAAGHRMASPHARFRLAQPTVRLAGTPDQIDAARRQHRDLLVRFQAHLARATGRPVDAIADDMRAGRTLDAAEALAYGLIDDIPPTSR